MLLIARHGRTSWNATGRFQGRADVPLDGEGRRQAAALAARVGRLVRRPTAVYASHLRRAFETAAAVASAVDSVVCVEPDLAEVDVGGWEGLTSEEVARRFPSEYRSWTEHADQRRDLRRGGGETLAEAGVRVAGCIARILPAHPAGDVVVVAHGMSLEVALDELAQQGVVDWTGPAPHLGNAEYLMLPVSSEGLDRLPGPALAPE